MNIPVSIKDKKRFIQWFLNQYQLKKRESVWILNYLVNHPQLLENVHFVREAKFCSRSIIMSTHCSTEVPFRFYKNQLVTTDAEKAFHDIRLNQNDDLYLQLNFKDYHQCVNYVAVLEENPCISQDHYITKQDRELAKQILDHSLYQYEKEILMGEIDLALDNLDQEKFIELSKEFYKLEKRKPDQPKLQKQ